MKQDSQTDDLWIVMKERMISTQKLDDINDFIFVRTCWHGVGKSKSMKVKVVGSFPET